MATCIPAKEAGSLSTSAYKKSLSFRWTINVEKISEKPLFQCALATGYSISTTTRFCMESNDR